MRRLSFFILHLSLLAASVSPLEALEARVGEVRTFGRVVRAVVELREAATDKFRTLVESGGTLHLTLAAELWEDRPAWDRLVRPAAIGAFRLLREPAAGAFVLVDRSGEAARYTEPPRTVSVRLDLAPVDLIAEDRRYYLHVVATLGALAQEEIEGIDEAVFGRRGESGSLGSVARFVFRNLLQINEYLQSRTSETTSRRMSGKEIRRSK